MNTLRQATMQALEALIENARSLGATQAGKHFGSYSQEDAKFERVFNESIKKHKASIIAALEQPEQEPEHGDIRALKYRIHELEGEVIGYKRMIEEAALKKLADLGQQIEQEPVAWCTKSDLENIAKGFSQDVSARSMRVPQLYPKESTVLLYTTPPAAQRKPLDERDIDAIRHSIGVDIDCLFARKFARAIEAAHGIKENT